MRELASFTWKQLLCSLFPLWIFLGLWLSANSAFGLSRYDFMLVACLTMQAVLLRTGLETKAEFRTICLFHLIGLGLELYKVRHGSWSYPEPALFKVAGVPVYSGFMYASVASYFVQAWRRFDLQFHRFPTGPWGLLVGLSIYANFFLSRSFGDNRWLIVAGVFAVFGRTTVSFIADKVRRQMPLILGFFLIGLFVWFAENLCTYMGAWQYPYQRASWSLVDLGKLSSWCLLVIVSFMIVAFLKRVESAGATEATLQTSTEPISG